MFIDNKQNVTEHYMVISSIYPKDVFEVSARFVDVSSTQTDFVLRQESEKKKTPAKNNIDISSSLIYICVYRYLNNTKAAVIRIGLEEAYEFSRIFLPGTKMATFFESCGIADFIVTCYGGKHRLVGEAFVKTGKVSH